MFWNRTYGHVRIIYFSRNFDANGKCTMQDEKVRIFQLDGVIKQIERYCEKFAYSVLTTRWLEDIMASMRDLQTLSEIHTRL
jgi:hypothetical protein